jgi:hypothetical protein
VRLARNSAAADDAGSTIKLTGAARGRVPKGTRIGVGEVVGRSGRNWALGFDHPFAVSKMEWQGLANGSSE